VTKGQSFSEVESTKSVSDIYAPVSGTVTAVNEALNSQPELVNTDPYGEGWICEITMGDETELGDLLDAAADGNLTGA
jgi:glycine cleavage system H protein